MFRKARLASITILAVILFVLGGSGISPAQTGYTPSVPAAAPAAATPLPVVSIAAGYEHTCVLISGGKVKCWGSNRYGQLGPITETIHPFPVDMDLTGIGGTVTEITAGAYHTCALIGTSVWCWGRNFNGQLGNGQSGTKADSSAPVQVKGLSAIQPIQHISAGFNYTCAQGATSVACWGQNTYGQLGDGTTTDSATAVVVLTSVGVILPNPYVPLTNVAQISASFDHTCALLNDGTAQCWGRNRYGQLGNGASGTGPGIDSPVGVQVTSLPSNVTIIAAGAQHTCVLTSSHTVYCWGDGSLGQMGNGDNKSVNPKPIQVKALNTAASISTGGYTDTGHVCVVTSGSGVMCWGSNDFGQIGDGTNLNRLLATSVSGLTNVSAIEVGINHTCALLSDNTLSCWGSDSSGQLGDGVSTFSSTPVNVSGAASGVTLLGTGENTTCGLINGEVMCWGGNRNQQVGDLTSINRPAPTKVAGLSGTIKAIDGGMTETCALVNDSVVCWGTDFNPAVPTTIINSGVTQISVTGSANVTHGCAVVNGAAMCWGDNSQGELGNGTQVPSPTSAVQVAGLTSGVQSVTTGQYFSCALLTSGQAWCWGENDMGQLGNGTISTTPALQPVQVQGLPAVTALAAGQDHACALTSAGGVVCWGYNKQGQLGNGNDVTQTAPTQVYGLSTGATQISAGGYHTCALVSGGVKCWGYNSFGQLGNGQTIISKVPVNVSGLPSGSGVLTVSASGYFYDEEHTCALTSKHGVLCWGSDMYGQLGDNLPIMHTVPVHVLGLANGPEIGVNYSNGNIGSYFRFAVANFPSNATLTLTANGGTMGQITASSEGYAIFHVMGNTLTAGPVTIQATDGGTNTVSTTLSITGGAPSRVQEGSGPVYFASTNFFYIPAVFR